METNDEKKCCETKKCACFCHKMPGVFLILIGLAGLLRVLTVLTHIPFWIVISILVILAGLKVMCGNLCKCCDKE